MPAQTVEQVKVRVDSLRKALADLGESADGAKRRAAAKQLRRAQRKHRRLSVAVAKNAAEKKADAPTADAAAARAEAAPAEPAETADAPEGEKEASGEA